MALLAPPRFAVSVDDPALGYALLAPVVSKNTSNGEMPEARTALARSVSPPLVALHEGPAPVVEDTLTVADWLALPPAPVQVSV